jgi:hypothetical protein
MDERDEGVDLGALSQFGQIGKAIAVQQRLELSFVRMRLENTQPPRLFQAEYEGSFPSPAPMVSSICSGVSFPFGQAG